MPIYKVDVEIEALVYAPSKDAAKKIAADALRTEHAAIGSMHCYDGVRLWDAPPEDSIYPDGWDEGTIIYSDEQDDLTVAEARKLP